MIGGPKKPPAPQTQAAAKSGDLASSPNAGKKSAPLASPRSTDQLSQTPLLGAHKDHAGAQSNEAFAKSVKAKLGSESLSGDALHGLSDQLFAEHAMILLANKRQRQGRTEVLKDVADLLLGLGQKKRIQKILALMASAGQIVDIYPLEVLNYILEHAPEMLPKHCYASFVRNRDELQTRCFQVETPIELKVPLALKMRSFALDGGGNPGYSFAPGPPGAYFIEFGEAGTFSLLLRGEIRKESRVERLIIKVERATSEPS